MRRQTKIFLLLGFTASGILMGLVSIFLILLKEAYIPAAVLILASALIDRYDGRIARSIGLRTKTGEALDTVNDLVSFTLAPMSLVFAGGLFTHTYVSFLLIILFLSSAVFRLFRYHKQGSPHHFQGLPTTISGTMFVLIFLIVHGVPISALDQGFFYGAVIVGLSALMVSRMRFSKV